MAGFAQGQAKVHVHSTLMPQMSRRSGRTISGYQLNQRHLRPIKPFWPRPGFCWCGETWRGFARIAMWRLLRRPDASPVVGVAGSPVSNPATERDLSALPCV